MTEAELERQVEHERKELEAAPKIPVAALQPAAGGGRAPGSGESGRCGWCGQFTDDLVIAEPAMADPRGNILRPARYKGVKCCGGRHL
jgi:hypothetical protein